MRILIATYDEPFRRGVARYLRKAGYAVTELFDGLELLEFTRRERPALILVDAMMPRMDGFEPLRLLREEAQFAHLPAILMIGKPADASWVPDAISKPHGFFRGPVPYHLILVKPYLTRSELPRLVEAIAGLIGPPA